MVGENEPTPPDVRRRRVRPPSLETQLNQLRESSEAEANALRESLAESNARRESSEAELNTLRESLETLVVERDQARRQVTEGELALERSRADELARQEEVSASIEIFDGLVAGGHLAAPGARTLSGYVENVARQLVASADSQRVAVERITELEGQLASGEQALREGIERIADLQGQIDTRVAEGQVRIAELEVALADAQNTLLTTETEDQKISQLIEENRRLAEQMETLPGDLAAMRQVAEDARAGLDSAIAEAEARIRSELTDQINLFQGQRDSLQAQLDIVTKQLGDEGKPPLLPADKLAEMVGGLVDQMQGSLGGLRIRDGDVKLKVAFGVVDEVGGFMIPAIDSPPELRENLQEITFRFDRASG